MTFGCGLLLHLLALLQKLIKGKTLEEAWKLTNKSVVEALDGLPQKKFIVLYLRNKLYTKLSITIEKNQDWKNGKINGKVK